MTVEIYKFEPSQAPMLILRAVMASGYMKHIAVLVGICIVYVCMLAIVIMWKSTSPFHIIVTNHKILTFDGQHASHCCLCIWPLRFLGNTDIDYHFFIDITNKLILSIPLLLSDHVYWMTWMVVTSFAGVTTLKLSHPFVYHGKLEQWYLVPIKSTLILCFILVKILDNIAYGHRFLGQHWSPFSHWYHKQINIVNSIITQQSCIWDDLNGGHFLCWHDLF